MLRCTFCNLMIGGLLCLALDELEEKLLVLSMKPKRKRVRKSLARSILGPYELIILMNQFYEQC